MEAKNIVLNIAIFASAVAAVTPQILTICGKNEQWSACEIAESKPERCEQIGQPIEWAKSHGPCKGGCVCIDDYVRNNENVCILATECANCGGDLNATVSLSPSCRERCSTFETTRGQELYDNCPYWIDPIVWYGLECQCKDGYVIDDVTEKCIRKNDCPKSCGGDVHARPNPCSIPCQPTCANRTVDTCTRNCVVNGCDCILEYIRDKPNGKCIPVEDCPSTAAKQKHRQ